MAALFIYVFFENWNKGAYAPAGYAGVINYYLKNGHAPDAWKSVMSFMASQAAVTGPAQAVTELGFGVLLLVGVATRLVGLAAFGFLTSLWISEWGAAWIWELLVPMIVALVVGLGAAGRKWGLDAALRRRYPALPLW
ncbi:MAG: DoxX family membrane protein [Acidobacteria bacterium]|nr:DoxX family membrane protein [Acidobacteriota bacterium]